MKKIVKEKLNEQTPNTRLKGDPEPLDYSIITWDWNAEGSEIAESIQDALKRFGIFVTEYPNEEGNDQYTYILANRPLSKKEANKIVQEEEGWYAGDDEEDEE